MNPTLKDRIGDEAAQHLQTVLPNTPLPGSDATVGSLAFSLATEDSVEGCLTGIAVAEALGAPVEGRSREWIRQRIGRVEGFLTKNPTIGSDTELALLTVDAVLDNPSNHPQSLANRLLTSTVRSRGQTLDYTRDQLKQGAVWWKAAAPNSAGTAGPARCAAIGLLWSGNPERAAYEAALSCSLTHSHPVAIAGAAATAAAVSTAASGTTLDLEWLNTVAAITESTTSDTELAQRIRAAVTLSGQDISLALDLVGTQPVSWQTVPAALLCAASAASPMEAVLTAVNAGGDTDTVASMTGAIVGAARGMAAWPISFLRIDGIPQVQKIASRITAQVSQPQQSQAPESSQATSEVHISFLLDRSGSMAPLIDDVIGGFNSFIANQRTEPGECIVTAAQFDGTNPYELLYDEVPIERIDDLDTQRYRPRGTTPLFDAVANLINREDKQTVGSQTSHQRIVVIFTDGQENSSRTWNRDQVFALIEQKKAEGWTFVFMGANQDSYAEGGRLGIYGRNVQNYRGDGQGMREAWGSVDRAFGEYRRSDLQERGRRRDNFFDGTKEAESDHINR